METSDHVPCIVTISTSIPMKRVFIFENFWMEHSDFLSIVQQGWVALAHISNPARVLTAKFKNLRKVLKAWHKTISNLKLLIQNVKLTLSLMLLIEEFRDLTIPEWNFKLLLKQKLSSLLQTKRGN